MGLSKPLAANAEITFGSRALNQSKGNQSL